MRTGPKRPAKKAIPASTAVAILYFILLVLLVPAWFFPATSFAEEAAAAVTGRESKVVMTDDKADDKAITLDELLRLLAGMAEEVGSEESGESTRRSAGVLFSELAKLNAKRHLLEQGQLVDVDRLRLLGVGAGEVKEASGREQLAAAQAEAVAGTEATAGINQYPSIAALYQLIDFNAVKDGNYAAALAKARLTFKF